MNALQQLFQPRKTSSDTSDDTLGRWIDLLRTLVNIVPRADLSKAERSALQGFGFLEAGLLCFVLTRALRKDPAAFPEIPGEGERLASLGRRETLWFTLREALRTLAERADDQFLLARAERVRRALQLLNDYRAQDALAWSQGSIARCRRDLLRPAEWTRDAWQRRFGGKKKRKAK